MKYGKVQVKPSGMCNPASLGACKAASALCVAGFALRIRIRFHSL